LNYRTLDIYYLNFVFLYNMLELVFGLIGSFSFCNREVCASEYLSFVRRCVCLPVCVCVSVCVSVVCVCVCLFVCASVSICVHCDLHCSILLQDSHYSNG
jgi:hypothetical protein